MSNELSKDTHTESHSAQYVREYSFRSALMSLTVLFFMWGFITSLNDILIPYLKKLFLLSYTQAMLVQLCFFGAYFVVSIPAGHLCKKLGYQRGIVIGLALSAVGGLLFYPAASVVSYGLFLSALFVLASGITILQVAANPYVTALGSEETASGRLTMTQAFNALGTTIAPFFGGLLIFGAVSHSTEVTALGSPADAVKLPYLLIAGTLLALSFIFYKLKLPDITSHSAEKRSADNSRLFDHPHLILGAIGIFLYVGAEVSIGSFLINFFTDPQIGNMTEKVAANLIAYYWGGAMLGRFLGASIMHFVPARFCLVFCSLMVTILIALSIQLNGNMAMYSILAVGLFNSIMFPTIFSLALTGLKSLTGQGSGLLCLAIVGGAIVPMLQGVAADSFGLQQSFWVPLLCYLFVGFYGLKGATMIAWNQSAQHNSRTHQL
ncbi:sugar MFS transporter [Paraglaciecola aquimarina]|uniref:Sugar MFS transporter n=1 Tax=Paraglaciecola algarum TaxID=3050085 RepID=A0ABS9D9W1_9ALTE|nr:sugar MFS transporter [Paraglaciecola sp. G1-23]MCF2949170.1 sugar MFS transporter [Paraglaciecola sp. G1-23]